MDVLHAVAGSDAETITWWQMIVRAAIITVYAILLLRLGARRALGDSTVLDIVLAIVVGSALSRALTGTAELLPTMAATGALMILHWLIAALSIRLGWFSFLVKGRPTRIIHRGTVDWPAAKRALVGEHDLSQDLRLQGIASEEAVEAAYLERNGKLSIIRRE